VVVIAAYVGTNYIAHGTLRLPYMHRGDGPLLFTLDVERLSSATEALDGGQAPAAMRQQFTEHELPLSDDIRVRQKIEQLAKEDPRRWIIEDENNQVAYSVRILNAGDEAGPATLAVHRFDDWYDYEYTRATDGRVIQSYWRTPAGIDKGEPDLAKYTFHALIGHHGIFSLTPVWLLMLPGVVLMARQRSGYGYPALAGMIATITIVCLAFYILRPPLDRNYGGMTSGFRWVFWLAPLWLLAALPAADWLAGRRWGRGLAYALLALSVVSVVYPTWNPWTYPWLTDFWLYLDWEQF
jgi:hypothetical protein